MFLTTGELIFDQEKPIRPLMVWIFNRAEVNGAPIISSKRQGRMGNRVPETSLKLRMFVTYYC